MTVTELHIVVGRNGFIREQDSGLSFESVVTDIIRGQFENADRVIRITPPKPGWPHHHAIEDVTKNIAWAIHSRCDGRREYLVFGSPAYVMVEQHVGIAHARTCLECEEVAQ